MAVRHLDWFIHGLKHEGPLKTLYSDPPVITEGAISISRFSETYLWYIYGACICSNENSNHVTRASRKEKLFSNTALTLHLDSLGNATVNFLYSC